MRTLGDSCRVFGGGSRRVYFYVSQETIDQLDEMTDGLPIGRDELIEILLDRAVHDPDSAGRLREFSEQDRLDADEEAEVRRMDAFLEGLSSATPPKRARILRALPSVTADAGDSEGELAAVEVEEEPSRKLTDSAAELEAAPRTRVGACSSQTELLSGLTERFLAREDLSQSTVRVYRGVLGRLLEATGDLAVESIGQNDLEALSAQRCEQGISEATIRTDEKRFRTVLRWSGRTDLRSKPRLGCPSIPRPKKAGARPVREAGAPNPAAGVAAGSVRLDEGSGVWLYQCGGPDGEPVERRGGRARQEAEAALGQCRRAAFDSDPGAERLASLVERFPARKDLSSGTVRGYRSTFGVFLEFVGDLEARLVHAEDVAEFVESRRATGVQESTCNAEVRRIRSLMRWGGFDSIPAPKQFGLKTAKS